MDAEPYSQLEAIAHAPAMSSETEATLCRPGSYFTIVSL